MKKNQIQDILKKVLAPIYYLLKVGGEEKPLMKHIAEASIFVAEQLEPKGKESAICKIALSIRKELEKRENRRQAEAE